MRSIAAIILSLLLGLPIAGCELFGDGTPVAECELQGRCTFLLAVSTDKASYTLAADSLARVSLVNLSDQTVFLPMGVYVLVERFSNGTWGDEKAWFVADGSRAYIALAVGGRTEARLPLKFALQTVPGRYRFVFRVYKDKKLSRSLPLAQRVSAAFEVVE